MRDFINIGSTLLEEECAQVGSKEYDYYQRAMKECKAFKRQLERKFPKGEFSIKGFPHDFGTYYEVVAWFDLEATDTKRRAAFDAEANTPSYWDEEALKEGVRGA